MHPHPGAASALILIILAVTFCYITACVIWPFTACRKCGGRGRHLSPSGRAWRLCRRCGGNGARLRTGRRIWNYIRDNYTDSRR